jgi:hypothetical protein
MAVHRSWCVLAFLRGVFMRSCLVALWLGVVLAIAAWGCGSSESTPGGDGGVPAADSSPGDSSSFGDGGFADAAPIPLGDLCPLFTQDLCTYLMQCLHAPYCDMNHCLAENTCYGLPELTKAAQAGAVLYDPSKVGACDARFRAAPCDFGFFLFTPDIFEVLSYCPGTLTPQLKQGDACDSSGECAAGLYCSKQGNRCPGTCTAYATSGQSCAGTVQCDANSMCVNNVCEPNGSSGSPCKTDTDCGPIIICIGGPCNDLNLWCDKTSQTCKPGVAPGAACGVTPTGNVQCEMDAWCDAFPGGQGMCRSSGGAGAPCSDAGGCQKGLHCVGYKPFAPGATLGTCSPPAPAGGSCTFDTDCASGLVCPSNVCSQPVAAGGMCNKDSDCQKGLICPSHTCVGRLCPGDACADAGPVCSLSVCKNGQCADHVKVGAPCATGTDCTTGACISGLCADTSVCANP